MDKVKTSIGYGVHQNRGRVLQPLDPKRFKGVRPCANKYPYVL
jgi:hypothetical protein